jgi:DNA modification methylase
LELNKVYHMNCLEGLKQLKESNEKIDLVVTSPPYFNARDYSTWATYEDYLVFLTDVFTLAYEVLKDGRMCAVNISVIIQPREKRNDESKRIALPFHFVNLMENIGFKFLEDIIWIKPEGASKNRNGRFFQDRQPVQYKPNIVNEYIFVFQKPMKGLIDKVLKTYKGEIKERSLVSGDYDRSNVWYINPKTNSKHPAPYPVELPEKIIKYYSYVGDVVVDPFSGEGNTFVACKKSERDFIGFEIHQKYIDLMIN